MMIVPSASSIRSRCTRYQLSFHRFSTSGAVQVVQDFARSVDRAIGKPTRLGAGADTGTKLADSTEPSRSRTVPTIVWATGRASYGTHTWPLFSATARVVFNGAVGLSSLRAHDAMTFLTVRPPTTWSIAKAVAF